MSFLRLLNGQGIAGLGLSLAIALMAVVQLGQARHWKSESSRFEQLYASEERALADTAAGYRAAADRARAIDKANAERVAAEQRSINQRTTYAFEARIAAARAAADRLHRQPAAAAHRGVRRGASVPGLSAAPAGAAEAARKDGLPPPDRLIATEQAIQLDELIKWVEAQAKVDNNGRQAANPPSDDQPPKRGEMQ